MNRGIRVALIDDDASVRRALIRLLRCAGYEVETYATAADFLGSRATARVDCALVDVRMPGETGFTLVKFLRASGIPMPVILMTGDADVTLTAKAARCGAFALLAKPLTDAALVEAIEVAVVREPPVAAKPPNSR
ncbi:MAG: response regulator [Acidobacteria bacterium]|nr:MAG: response regulator [Acidobacteriota bacterium]